jgi:glycosyltransferase involved in cell wall biosynthesis
VLDLSVIVPAHNEAELLPRGLDAITAAQARLGRTVETIVVANRCTDRTAHLAAAAGARVVDHDARNIASVRNAGAATATGDVIVTIDADSVMSPRTFVEIERQILGGRVVGGATRVVPERWSPGIVATYAAVRVLATVTGLGGGLLWCRRDDFEAVGGFDESVLIAEDLDFARRLRDHGRMSGRRFTTLRIAPMTASCRKFDRFGDWHMFRMPFEARAIARAARGLDTRWADRYFFDFNG